MNQSPYFTGNVGETVPAATFPANNYLIDDTRYSYEGNWAFCRFNSPEIFGARFGFGRGGFDWSDYGATTPISRSFLMLHLELMTKDGAVLWLGTGKYRAEQVRLTPGKMAAQLLDGDHEIFNVQGWPEMEWHLESDDREVEVRMTSRLPSVTILPDCVMQHNRFAMWLAVASIQGEVRFRDLRTHVAGTMFYDHPRINIVTNECPIFGWYLYMPMHFADGSRLAAYYAENGHGRPVPDYCFGLYLDPQGRATWLPHTELMGMVLGTDDKPDSWTARWKVGNREWSVRCAVKPTDILKAWGGPDVAQTRQANGNIPLVFDVEAELGDGKVRRTVTGGGLAEYLARSGYRPRY